MTESFYRPGLDGVVAGETAISSLADGLRYRGYAFEQLADQASFEETAYLLLHGELPRREELAAFRERVAAARELPEALVELLRSLPPRVPLVDVMRSGASLLAHWDPDAGENGREASLRKAERLLAQLPMILAAAARLREGKEPVPPRPELSLAANLLYMLTRVEPTEAQARALEVSLILYAEHEFNASTFTTRVIASTRSDLHSAVTGAIGALKGPLHGGANERVLEVLQEVGRADRAETWTREALAAKRLIMGFGHRVHLEGDPRATYLKPWCARLAAETGQEEMERAAEAVETVLRAEKNLLPNLDWPMARLYHYLGLPAEAFTPLFAVGRVAGWSAHFIEQGEKNRIIHPRAHYVGAAPRAFVPLGERHWPVAPARES